MLVVAAVLVVCAAAAAPVRAASVTALWTHNISDDSYYAVAFAGAQGVAFGTFGERQCRVDLFANVSGGGGGGSTPTATLPGVCHVAARGDAVAAVGYAFPDLTLRVAPDAAARDAVTHVFGGQYYYAYGVPPLAVTPGDVLVWGGRPDPLSPNNGVVACLYAVPYGPSAPAGNATAMQGPCLRDFGDGEAPEVIAASADGLTVVLSAGFDLRVFWRPTLAAPASAWTTRLSLRASAFTFSSVALSADGATLVYACAGTAVCARRYDAAAGTFAPLWTAPAPSCAKGFAPQVVALSADARVVAVGYNDESTSRSYAVAAFNGSDGRPLWCWLSALNDGVYVDGVVDFAFSADAAVLAVASWGDHKRVNPQLHFFAAATDEDEAAAAAAATAAAAAPLLATYATPGSVGQVDLLAAGAGAYYVAVAGLAQHENLGVIGGVATMLHLQL